MTWVLRVFVVLIVVCLGTAAATVRAEPAFAFVDAIQTQQDYELLTDLLQTPDAPPEPIKTTIQTKPEAAKKWLKVRGLVGRVPKWGTTASGVGTLTLGAGALYVGWELTHSAGVSDWIYGRVAGLSPAQAQPSSGTIRAYVWKIATICGGSIGSLPSFETLDGSPCVYTPVVRLSINSGSSWTEVQRARKCDTDGGAALDNPCENGSNSYNNTEQAVRNAFDAYLSSGAAGFGWEGITTTVSSNVQTDWYLVRKPSDLQHSNFTPTEQRPYVTNTDAGRKTHTTPSPITFGASPNYGSSDANTIETEIESDDDLSEAVDEYLHPGTATPATGDDEIRLPQPRLNETYTQYRTRLRNLGYLGTITIVTLDLVDAVPEFGPNMPVEIETPTTTIDLLDPWPSPAPTFPVPGLDSDITITINPEDAPMPEPEAPGSPEDPPAGVVPPPGSPGSPGSGGIGPGDCTCPPPDFTPITEIDYGDKFPFGVISMVGGFLGTTLFASPDAPRFEFDFDQIGVEEPYIVDLNIMDSYMSMIRTILTWCIWIGGLWWFGSRWFGFKGSGDVGEAVDDAW